MKKQKKYYIEVIYQTGNSFNHWIEVNILEMTWDNLDIAKENLQRIRDHYQWCKSKAKANNWPYDEKAILPKPEYVSKRYDFCFNLKADNGNECQVSAAWCGFFETLLSGSIKENHDENMSFDLT